MIDISGTLLREKIKHSMALVHLSITHDYLFKSTRNANSIGGVAAKQLHSKMWLSSIEEICFFLLLSLLLLVLWQVLFSLSGIVWLHRKRQRAFIDYPAVRRRGTTYCVDVSNKYSYVNRCQHKCTMQTLLK